MSGHLTVLTEHTSGAVSIGTLIITISLILIAGIAVSIFLQVSSILELQSMFTGEETLEEVVTGIEVDDIFGYTTENDVVEFDSIFESKAQGIIDLMAFHVKKRPGSPTIDLSHIVIQISDGDTLVQASYNSSYFNNSKGFTNVFTAPAFPQVAAEFGIIVISDEDSSITSALPVLTDNDRVLLTINVKAMFNGLVANTDISGEVIPEQGGSGSFEFQTPPTLSTLTTVTFGLESSAGYIYTEGGDYRTINIAESGTVIDDTPGCTLGQRLDSRYYIYRGFVFFDTSSIPDTAQIYSATLSLAIDSDHTPRHDFDVVIMNGQPTYPSDPLVASDYRKNKYNGNGGATNTTGLNDYLNIVLNSDGRSWISKTGTTKLCLRSSKDIAVQEPGGAEYIVFVALIAGKFTTYITISYYFA